MNDPLPDIDDEKTPCPFCLLELKTSSTIDWQKFFLIISGYDDKQLTNMALLVDKANEIIKKEMQRRNAIQKYEEAAPLLNQSLNPASVSTGIQGVPIPQTTQQFIQNILSTKWKGDKKCPVCKGQFWLANDQISQLMPWSGKNALVIGGPVQPVVTLICKDCGYTVFFNAVVGGIVKSGAPIKPST